MASSQEALNIGGGSVTIEAIGGRLGELIGLLAASSGQRKAAVVTDGGKMVGIIEAVTLEQLHERALADPAIQADLARTNEDLIQGRTVSARDHLAPMATVQWPEYASDE